MWEEWDSNPGGKVGVHYGGRPWLQILSSAPYLLAWDLEHVPYVALGIYGKTFITYEHILVVSGVHEWYFNFSPKVWNLERYELTKPLAATPWAAIKSTVCYLYEKGIWHPELWSLHIFAHYSPINNNFSEHKLPIYVYFSHYLFLLHTSTTVLYCYFYIFNIQSPNSLQLFVQI